MSDFSDLFGGLGRRRADSLSDLLNPKRANDTTQDRAANRRECEAKGHRYQVHGKVHPTKIVCSRCEVRWAIGPRTEPTT